MQQPLIVGSDLIAFAAAAKLSAAGAEPATLFDKRSHPATPWPARWYFRRWYRTAFQPVGSSVEIIGDGSVQRVRARPADGRGDPGGADACDCDGVLISGELIPNSELAAAAGLSVRMPDRIPVLASRARFADSSVFVAGNIRGGFHGAEWCYRDGRATARAVAAFLAARPDAG